MRVLVTAASRHGSTTDIAAALVRQLLACGVDAVELPPEDVYDLSEYDSVVLGSAVYAGRWLESAVALVTRCAPQLAELPVWLFSSGPVGHPANPAQGPDVSDLMARTGAVDHRVFAGKIDNHGLGLLERTMVRAVRAPEGDFRDWDQVSGWATGIADLLSSAHPSR